MTTDQQVRLLMSLIKKGLPLSTAAVKTGMSEPTARKYRAAGKLPGEMRAEHNWRTRPDPFAEVRPEVEALLEKDAGLQAKTVFEELARRYPGRFRPGQLRTLQRRFGVDPVWWTPDPLRRRSPQCHNQDHPMRRSSGSR